MRALVDLNVVLDLLFDRQPRVDDARPLLDSVLAGELEAHVSAHSITTLYYIGRKAVGSDRALMAVQRCLEAFEVAAVTRETLEVAASLRGRDFEDDVHIAAALTISADVIVTRDKSGFEASPVRVITPVALTAELRVRKS